MSSQPSPGHLVVISGPSGAGKSTVVRELLQPGACRLPVVLSVSATTRPPRPGELEGVNYFFLSHEEFARRKAADEFLECKEVFRGGHWYGTLQSEVAAGLAAGMWVILEIDVEGAMDVVAQHPQTITIFIHPGSTAELERRLRQRNTETEESIRRRLEVARHELPFKDRYRHEVINRDVPQAVGEICEILSRHAKEPPCSKL